MPTARFEKNLRDAGNGRRSPAARPAAGYIRPFCSGNRPDMLPYFPCNTGKPAPSKKRVRSGLSEIGLHMRLEQIEEDDPEDDYGQQGTFPGGEEADNSQYEADD